MRTLRASGSVKNAQKWWLSSLIQRRCSAGSATNQTEPWSVCISNQTSGSTLFAPSLVLRPPFLTITRRFYFQIYQTNSSPVKTSKEATSKLETFAYYAKLEGLQGNAPSTTAKFLCMVSALLISSCFSSEIHFLIGFASTAIHTLP